MHPTVRDLPHIGESVRAQGRLPLPHRRRPVHRRHQRCRTRRYAVFVRSPHAHATITRSTSPRAEAMPGVLGIFTGERRRRQGRRPAVRLADQQHRRHADEGAAAPDPGARQGALRRRPGRDGRRRDAASRPRTRPRLVEVDYEVLPAVVDVRRGRQGGGAAVHDEAPDNLCYDWAHRRQGRGRRRLRQGARTSPSSTCVNNRLIPNAMEPRAAIGSYNRGDDELHALRRQPEPARRAPADVRLRARPARAQGARDRARRRRRLRLEDLPLRRGVGADLGRASSSTAPIKWTAERSESFLSDAHGRDHVTPRRAGDGRRRQVPRRCGCTPTPTWAPTCRPSRRRADHPLRDAARRPVHHAADLRRGECRVHQHRAGRRLPRRRPARGHLPARAPGRRRCARELGIDPAEIRRAQLHHAPSRTRRRWRCSTTPATTTATLRQGHRAGRRRRASRRARRRARPRA